MNYYTHHHVLINLGNLHGGGAIQVAVSFIDELSRIHDLPFRLSVIASKEVHENLQAIKCDLSSFDNYVVVNFYGIKTLFLWPFLSKFKGVGVVFTLFGPLYVFSTSAINIVGFAQPWIIYPDNEVYESLSFFKKRIVRFKFQLQQSFFKRADRLVVELDHVKTRLVEMCSFDPQKIHVVNNSLNSIYFFPELWAKLNLNISKSTFNIVLVCRDYPHKNTNLLPKIKQSLNDLYGLHVDFYVTFNKDEWDSKSDCFRESINNVGSLSVAQCPDFYKQMDAVIFPSFLECFSATPLEAMFMGKPLFASDRQFVRDICGDFAYYFDPQNHFSAAEVIADYILKKNRTDHGQLLSAAKHVRDSFSPSFRAQEYLRIIRDSINAAN